MNWSTLFPKIEHPYLGPKIPFYFLILVTLIDTGRSLIHIFAPDGGANSIASIAINVAGGVNLIALFAQWGAIQLLLALVYWLVILRYQFLTPAMLACVVLEQIFRMGAGNLKPLEVIAPPPGALGSQILLPLALFMLLWSLRASSPQN